jgi:excisionase family DNA binding protein
MRTQPPSTLLTRREAATVLRLSLATVDRHIHAGVIRAVRIGGAIRIPQQVIDELLAPATGKAVRSNSADKVANSAPAWNDGRPVYVYAFNGVGTDGDWLAGTMTDLSCIGSDIIVCVKPGSVTRAELATLLHRLAKAVSRETEYAEIKSPSEDLRQMEGAGHA